MVLLTISNTVQNAIIGNDNSGTGGLVGALTLLAVNYGVVRFLFRHRRLDELLAGSSTRLIEHGRVLNKALAKELLTRSDLNTVLHRQGYRRVDEVEQCDLEPGGTFFIERKEPPADELQRKEIVARLEELKQQIEALGRARP